MAEPRVVQMMREFKVGLLTRERRQMDDMARHWLTVENALEAQIEALARAAAEARAAGQTVSRSAVYRMNRAQSLLAQLRQEVQGYAGWADGVVTAGQEELAALGIEQATAAIRASAPEMGVFFDVLPTEAVMNLVGLAGDGSPLRTLLEATWGDSAQGLVDALLRGTALGWNPRKTAQAMRRGATVGLDRMLTIARTEQLRVYREASRAQYERSGVVSGFKRLATHDDRVCAACLMAEGEVYQVQESLRDHPNGRCTSVPVVIGMPEVQWQYGQEWFKEQPQETQEKVLGAKYYAAWKDGAFELGALTQVVHDDTWGDSVRVRLLRELMAASETN